MTFIHTCIVRSWKRLSELVCSSWAGANPDQIDDRGVGWLCGYQGPLQDIVSVFDGFVGESWEWKARFEYVWDHFFLPRWKPIVFNQALELSFLKWFDSECQGTYRFIWYIVISVSKCRGIHWCSNILLFYHLPGNELGQPHLWCVCIWIIVTVSVKHRNSHTLLGWQSENGQNVRDIHSFCKTDILDWSSRLSYSGRSWKGDQSLNCLRMRWKHLVTVNWWVSFQIN